AEPSERRAPNRFGGEVEQAYEAARSSTRARAVLTLIIIFIVFSSVVLILWIGLPDMLTGLVDPGAARPAQRGLVRSLGRIGCGRAIVRDIGRQIADHGAGLTGGAAVARPRRCRV